MTLTCTKCNLEKKEAEFYVSYTSSTGYDRQCKSCKNLYSKNYAKKRPKELKRLQNTLSKQRNLGYAESKSSLGKYPRKHRAIKLTPKQTRELKEFYANRPEGFVVDHIIPLQGKLISGLHVPSNLQYLTAGENNKKGYKYVTDWETQ